MLHNNLCNLKKLMGLHSGYVIKRRIGKESIEDVGRIYNQRRSKGFLVNDSKSLESNRKYKKPSIKTLSPPSNSYGVANMVDPSVSSEDGTQLRYNYLVSLGNRYSPEQIIDMTINDNIARGYELFYNVPTLNSLRKGISLLNKKNV